jgi:DNA-binding PucR family transcriptional regulator
MAREATDGRTGTTALLSEVVSALGRLVRSEVNLARAEAAESVRGAVSGAVRIAIAAILALVGLNVLADAAVAALALAGLGPAWAALGVGAVLCALALGLALSGRRALQLRGLLPDRALRNLKRDAEVVSASLQDRKVHHV